MKDPRIAEATEIVSRLWHSFPEEAVQPIACALAAAEERGRRRVFADPEALARRFHETYERLAPDYGYETRKDSAVSWEKVPEKNRRLMIAVCAALAPRDSAPVKRDPYVEAGVDDWAGAPRDSAPARGTYCTVDRCPRAYEPHSHRLDLK